MTKNNVKQYEIDSNIIKNYVDIINSTTIPMSQISLQMKSETIQNEKIDNNFNGNLKLIIEVIKQMTEEIRKLSVIYPNEQTKILTSIIKQIMNNNNGIISSRLIEPLGISRQYLSILENNNEIERVSRGIYQFPNVFEDSFYSFQTKYKKVIFSHMNALYFHGMTEEFPYNYTVTVSQNYHTVNVNEKCNVFYVFDDILELGICEVVTPNGNRVRAYDIERCICDIIRSKNRMDLEQVKKTLKQYMKSKNKNITKLSEYSRKMGIDKQVIEMVGMFND